MNQAIKFLLLISVITLLNACSSDRYKDKHDSTPDRAPSQAELKDAIARAEPYSRGGNKDYEVWGKPYKVLSSAKGFEETGIASWYGKKFHGHLTSNGEIYDMYTMTAAHKNLPLPTYLTVTNLANNKSVVVRVNDRGPFHSSRIIDLSYSAAHKLEMLTTGTARVKISAITDFDPKTGLVRKVQAKELINKQTVKNAPSSELAIHTQESNSDNNSVVSSPTNNKSKQVDMGIATPYIQVLVTSKKEVAISTASLLKTQYKQNTNYPEQAGLYRIQIGPIQDLATLNALLSDLKKNGYPNAYPRATPL